MKLKITLRSASIYIVAFCVLGTGMVNAATLKLTNSDFKPVVIAPVQLDKMVKKSPKDVKKVNSELNKEVEEKTNKEVEEKVNKEVDRACEFESPEEKVYSADFITVRRKLRVDEDEEFKVKAFFRNTGTTPWFKANGKCSPKMSLKTTRSNGRKSVLYPGDKVKNSNWESAKSVALDQDRVDPGKIGSFTFIAKAPSKADILKEYFAPYIWGAGYIEDAEFSYNIIVGDPDFTYDEMRKKIEYTFKSGSVMNIDLDGDKLLLVDLSEQTVKLMLGDAVVKEFPVSTGKASTPTPVGEYKISLKQDVRVSHSSPHYIMPKFMWFRAGGYGFHALPSLQYGSGSFWTEARNHIGRPVSHGCVRLLPEDADYLYDFADVGTSVKIQW